MLRFLLVEDDVFVAAHIDDVLSHGGYQVVDSRLAAAPEDLHEPQLGFGERVGFLRRHLYPVDSAQQNSKGKLLTHP